MLVSVADRPDPLRVHSVLTAFSGQIEHVYDALCVLRSERYHLLMSVSLDSRSTRTTDTSRPGLSIGGAEPELCVIANDRER